MLPTVPLALAALTGLAGWRVFRRTKGSELTLERKSIYEAALSTLKDPSKLRKLADSFSAVGLHNEAEMLRKRAALRELPEDVKAARKATYRKAMASKNKTAILQVAAAYEKEGATGAAQSLRRYAAGLIDEG